MSSDTLGMSLALVGYKITFFALLVFFFLHAGRFIIGLQDGGFVKYKPYELELFALYYSAHYFPIGVVVMGLGTCVVDVWDRGIFLLVFGTLCMWPVIVYRPRWRAALK